MNSFVQRINKTRLRNRHMLKLLASGMLIFSGYLSAQITQPDFLTFKKINSFIQPATQTQYVPSAHKQMTVPNYAKGITAQDVMNQINRQAMNQMGYHPPNPPTAESIKELQQTAYLQEQVKKKNQIEELRALLNEDMPEMNTSFEALRKRQTSFYRSAFSELMKMQTGEVPFSLKKAIFLIENAYFDNTLSYAEYNDLIQIKVRTLRSLMKKEGISENNDLGKNYLIQKLFSERIVEYKDTVVWRVHKPYMYDFEDYWGDEDWSQMFVTKLLRTSKGQCHSMPLLYLILAEEIDAEAWLALAPEHSYILFRDESNLIGFETTNGNVASEAWLMESGYINSAAIKNRLFLDTLDQNGLITTLMADLIMGYRYKFGYDDYLVLMTENILKINPKSIQGLIFKADLCAIETRTELKTAGYPPIEEIQKYPELLRSFQTLYEVYDQIDELGYVKMPQEAYAGWLTKLNDEKHKQESQKLKTSIIRDVKDQ